MNCDIIMQYKLTKWTRSEVMYLFFLSSTCFEHDDSSSARRLYIQAWYSVFYLHLYMQYSRYKSVFDRTHTHTHTHTRMRTHTCTHTRARTHARTHTHTSTYKTVHTDACNTHNTIPVNTTVSLMMNRRVRNMLKTSKFKNKNINLVNVQFVGLFCIVTMCIICNNTIMMCAIHDEPPMIFTIPINFTTICSYL